MYEGWLTINGKEVINTHRAMAYAQTAGVAGIYGCSACTSVMAADPFGARYRSPLLDTGNRPPWWPTSGNLATSDALDFLGVLGVQIDGVDDSMRQIKVTEGVVSGGYLGPLRYRTREITVRAVLLAGSECALGYGLNWLRSVDSADNCDSSLVGLYECCPHVHASDCLNPNCATTCILPYARTFKGARITKGPEVLRKFELSARGHVAEVEFTIVCGDPAIYSTYVTPLPVSVPSVPVTDDPPLSPRETVDGFAVQSPYPPIPSLQQFPAPLQRTTWVRQQIDVDGPIAGARALPVVAIESDEPVADLRLTIVADTDARQYLMQRFPAGGRLVLDFAARTVTTRSGEHEAVRNHYVRRPDGGPITWPDPLDAAGFTVLVDRPTEAAPLRIGATAVGLVGA